LIKQSIGLETLYIVVRRVANNLARMLY